MDHLVKAASGLRARSPMTKTKRSDMYLIQRVDHVQFKIEKLPTTESRMRRLVVLDEKIMM